MKWSDAELWRKGKVRDIYRVRDEGLVVLVATDRISAFDVVMKEMVPDKGKVLNLISYYWFEKLKDVVGNVIVAVTEKQFSSLFEDAPLDYVVGRAMAMKEVELVPMECIVRGYLTGSGLKAYEKSGGVVQGIQLPSGLKNGSKLPEPIFTPSTKEEGKHDVPLTHEQARALVGDDVFERVEKISLRLYERAHAHMLNKGYVLADTKFEFGIVDGDVVLVDEVLTPDSSRFWDLEEWKKGRCVNWDKQILRDYLESIEWNKKPPAPSLPKEVIDNVGATYKKMLKEITGKGLVEWEDVLRSA